MKKGLGQAETRLFAYVQMRGLRTVRAGQLIKPLQLSAIKERKLFSRLAKAGLIARVWRGLYLVPSKLPLGGQWTPDEILALNTLMNEQKGRYQICGANAFNRYGFDEQVPTRVYAYNNRLSGDRRIGSVDPVSGFILLILCLPANVPIFVFYFSRSAPPTKKPDRDDLIRL